LNKSVTKAHLDSFSRDVYSPLPVAWSFEEQTTCFAVLDAGGQALG
jgi:hypothetical protein